MSSQEEMDTIQGQIAAEPENSVLYNNLGNIYFNRENFEEAKKSYQKAIDLNPNVAVYYENLGLANDRLKNPAAAVESYEKAAALFPSWDIYNTLGVAYFKLNQYDAAISNYLHAIELKKDDAILFEKPLLLRRPQRRLRQLNPQGEAYRWARCSSP